MIWMMLWSCQGKMADTSSVFADDVSPVLTDGRIWCNEGVDEAGPVELFFLEVEALDPQGELDLYDEATWTATLAQDGQVMIEDFLYLENGIYVYSFHQDQHPNIKCDELSMFRFIAQTTDWSGNESNLLELEIIGRLTADPN